MSVQNLFGFAIHLSTQFDMIRAKIREGISECVRVLERKRARVRERESVRESECEIERNPRHGT